MNNSKSLTDIQRFYKDSTVFLTGATGFIGKLILEKILRSLPVKKVYILVRPKKDVQAEKRVVEIFNSPAFDILKKTNPDVFKKVGLLVGDCSISGLGFSLEDRKTFVDEVNVIIHCAATTRFDQHIQQATFINVRSTRDIIQLANQIKHLKAFMYIGTAFSNSNNIEIDEKIYEPTISAEKLIAACESLDGEILTIATPKLIEGWPNTYTFTKQVAEDLLRRECQRLPVCILRPTIVVSTAFEPLDGFVDNVFTLAGFAMLNALGINRIVYYKRITLDIVPADFVVNECLAAGWHVGSNFTATNRTQIPVFNISSGQTNNISQDEVYNFCEFYLRQVPSPLLLVFPTSFRTTCWYNYLLCRFLFHTMIAHVVDLFLRVTGKKPFFVEATKKLHKFHESYMFFTIKEFYFHVDNTEKMLKRMSFRDKEMFNFDMTTINWHTYFIQYGKGFRVYLLKDPLSTLPEGRLKFKKLELQFYLMVALLVVILYALGKITLFRVLPQMFSFGIALLRSLVC